MIVLSVIFIVLGLLAFIGIPLLSQQSASERRSAEDAARTSREHRLRMEEQSQPEWQQAFQQELDRRQQVRQPARARRNAVEVVKS
ncbi:hypothetical protein [Tellurirhabdus rosea]|uniref:hypothetical protein n=1 Tax=Tellurirhabdus rosea TaxID=2674997 RepID=UPI00224CF7DB|nr:hypothetical protein [Tellurirhabdus rosea]